MSSHQDYLQRRRVAHILRDPATTLPPILTAREYAEIKAFTGETLIGGSSSLMRLAQHTPLKLDDPAKFNLRGLPILLVDGCPPAYPLCNRTGLRPDPIIVQPLEGAYVKPHPLKRPAYMGAAHRCSSILLPPC